MKTKIKIKKVYVGDNGTKFVSCPIYNYVLKAKIKVITEQQALKVQNAILQALGDNK